MADAEAGYGAAIHELSNGVHVVIKRRTSIPLVSMAAAWSGGVIRESPERAGHTSLMARSSLKGTAGHTAAQLAEESELLGGVIVPGVSSDLLRWTLTVPGRHFEAGFALLTDAALRPAFPAEEVEKERRILLNDLERLRDDMRSYPLRLFLAGAFPDHPYGRPPAQIEDAVRTTGPDDLADWHRDHVLSGRPWLFVVGDVEPERVLRLAERQFGALEPRATRRNAAPPPEWPAPEAPREILERREKAQTALAIGFPGPARGDDDLYAFELLSNVLSGLGGRLFDELRERRSLAYTVSAYPVTRRMAGAFTAYIATSPEKEEEARRGLLEQMDRLLEEPVSREEIERARRYTIGAWQIRSQTNGAQLLDLMDALLLGRGLGELDSFEARIREVTPDAIRAAMRRRFDPEGLVEGVVRGGLPRP